MVFIKLATTVGNPRKRWLTPLVVALVVVSCASPTNPVPGSSGEQAPSAANAPRALVMVTRIEPKTVAPRINIGGSTGTAVKALVAADLAIADERALPHPALAEALPQLGAESWRVFPDGRMETTYRLRSGLTWHDGAPLIAEDFVFARRVYTNQSLGLFTTQAEARQLEDVVALDARTVRFIWSGTYTEAGSLGFPPLPRHLLEQAMDQANPEAVGNLPYWNREYVGLGPYRIERWEPGAFIETTAFPGYALGQPRIERVRLTWISDPNIALTSLLSGESHIAVDDTLRFQAASVLRREWPARGGGVVLLSPMEVRYLQVQFRPELTNPKALGDVRTRRALVHAIDRQSLADGLLEGEGIPAHAMVVPQLDYFADVDRAVTKYPYDPSRTEQLLREVGYIRGTDGRGSDGFFASGGERFSFEHRATAGGQEEQELSVLLDGWRRVGFEASSYLIPPAQAQNGELRSNFPATAATLTSVGRDTHLVKLLSARIPGPENRWVGSNRGAWASPQYDELFERFNVALERAERNQAVVEMMKLVSDQVPAIPLYYNLNVVAHTAALVGPLPSAPEVTAHGNVHLWTWRG